MAIAVETVLLHAGAFEGNTNPSFPACVTMEQCTVLADVARTAVAQVIESRKWKVSPTSYFTIHGLLTLIEIARNERRRCTSVGHRTKADPTKDYRLHLTHRVIEDI